MSRIGKPDWPPKSVRTKTQQLSFWLRNSILTASEYSSHPTDDADDNSVTQLLECSSDGTDWIAQPQNIDEAMFCFYNGTRNECPYGMLEEESQEQEYDWLLDGGWEENHLAQRPIIDPLQISLQKMSLEDEKLSLEDDQHSVESEKHPKQRATTGSKLFRNANLAKLLPLTTTGNNSLHKFCRTSQLLMLQELEQQNPIMALGEEHSLLSTDVPLVIQYHNEPLDECIQPIPLTNFDLNSAEDLPSHFYHQNYDPIGHVLQTMPHWSSDKKTVDEYITQLLSQADECQATINVQLNSLIVENRPDIQKGIQQLYNIDREVSSAILYWNQARHFVDSARRQAFLQESLTLIQNSRIRSHYQKVLKTLEQCSNITALEKELHTILDDTTRDQWTPHSFDDYQRFMKMAMDLKVSANDGLGELKCFSQMKQRSSAVLTTVVGTLLHRELERVLVLSCREKGFSNSQYSTLLQVRNKK